MNALLLLVSLCAALGLVGGLGYVHDRTHRPVRELMLTLTPADHQHATYMRTYYLNVHGAEG